MSQEAAEMNFLNKAKWLDSYGVDLYLVMVKKRIDFEFILIRDNLF